MKYDQQNHQRRSIRLKGYDYASPGAYFVTIVTHGRECLLGEVRNGEVELLKAGQITEQQWRGIPGHFSNVELGAFVMMPNHVHGVIILHDVPCRGVVSTPGIATSDKTMSDIATGQGDGTPRLGGETPRLGGETPPLRQLDDNARRGVVSTPNIGTPGILSTPGLSTPDVSTSTGDGTPPLRQLGGETPPLPRPTLGQVVAYFKYQSTKQVNLIWDSAGIPLWQRNYYEHIIRNEEEHNRIHLYIESNPANWQDDDENPARLE
jgi:REP element-mobilizing transposase RayT